MPRKPSDQAPERNASEISAQHGQGTDLLSQNDEKKPRKKYRHKPTSRVPRMGFRVTYDEEAQIEYNALSSGLTVSDFLRAVALAGPIQLPSAAPAWNPRLAGRLGRIGNNIGQLLFHIETKRKNPGELVVLARAVMDEIPLTAAHISRQKTPPDDCGDSLFEQLADPGTALNNIVTILNAGRTKSSVAQGAKPHLEAIRQIMREVRSVR